MVLVKLPPPQGGEGGTARVTAKSPTGARTLAVVRVRAQPLEMLPASRVVSSMMKRDQTPFGLKFVKAECWWAKGWGGGGAGGGGTGSRGLGRLVPGTMAPPMGTG